jgi:multiple sugar transport system permease protein
MPQELFDAARMDGAGWWLLLRRLIVPLARPATAAYLAISVITAWNMYLWPLLAANAPHVQVLSEVVASIGQGDNFGYSVTQPQLYAATVITVIPMVFAFLLVQPAFVRGLTGSGVE